MSGWMQTMRNVVVLACPNFNSLAGETTRISLLKEVTYAWLSYASPALRKRSACSCGLSREDPSGKGYRDGVTKACGESEFCNSVCWHNLWYSSREETNMEPGCPGMSAFRTGT
eukprot:4613632-Amphidinium_carterae.1